MFHKRNSVGVGPNHRLIRNQTNRYQQDREELKTRSFSGMGSFFPAHDAYATESQGPVQDRTHEHLGSTDIAIAKARQMLLRAIRELDSGQEPPGVVREPAANQFPHLVVQSEVIPAAEDWRTYWRRVGRAEGYTAAAHG